MLLSKGIEAIEFAKKGSHKGVWQIGKTRIMQLFVLLRDELLFFYFYEVIQEEYLCVLF